MCMSSCLVACSPQEIRFVSRTFVGFIRMGAVEKTVLTALAHAFVLREYPHLGLPGNDPERKEKFAWSAERLRQCFFACPSYDMLIPALLEGGLEELPTRVFLQPGIPCKPMLATPSRNFTDGLARHADAELCCEFKYDGLRAQFHLLPDGSVRVFSRKLENITSAYPDAIATVVKVICCCTISHLCVARRDAICNLFFVFQLCLQEILIARRPLNVK